MHIKRHHLNRRIGLRVWLIASQAFLLGGLLAQTGTSEEPGPTASQRISYSNIERLLDSGVHSEAARRLENHLARHPHDRTARRMLVRTYLYLEEYYKVYEQSQRLLAERPGDREAEEWAATARAQIERIYPERVQRYTEILRRNPDDRVTRRALVEIMVQHGELDAAIEHFLIIFATDPENSEYQRHYARMLAWAARYEESIVEYQTYLEMENISEVDREQARYELAAIYAWAGQPGAAARLLRQVIDGTPGNLDARVLLGDLFRWNDDSDVARSIYTEVLEINPEHQGALTGLKELENLSIARAYQAERLNIEAMERRLAENPDDQDVRLQLARLYGVASRYPDAEVLFAEYLRRNPEHTPVRREYALALSVQQKYSQALEQLSLYLDEFPEDINVRNQVANIHMWQGDLDSAYEMIISTIELVPQNIELLWNLARIYQMNRQWEKALANYRKILEIDPTYRAPVAQIRQITNHPAYRIENLETRIQRSPRDTQAHLELAGIFIDLDRYFEAQTHAQTVLGYEPENSDAQRLLDHANTRLVEFRDRQIAQLQQRLRETPDDYEARLELARLLRSRGNYNESARQFAIYLQNNPDDHSIRRDYAQVLSWQPERRSEALAQLADLSNRMPDNQQLRIQYLQLRFWTGEATQRDREEIARLRRDYDRTLELDPNNIEALLILASLHELHEDWELALRRYQRVIEIESDNVFALDGIQRIETLPEYRIARMRDEIQQRSGHVDARLNLARYLMLNSRYFEAQEEAQGILRIDSNHREARDLHRRAGERLLELRRSQIRAFDERLRNDPDDSAARLGLARLHRDDGNYVQAARQYRFYLRIHPEDSRVRQEYARVLAWQEDSSSRREAIVQLDQLIEMFPEDNGLRLQRLQARAWSGLTNDRDRSEQERIRRALEDDLDFNPYNTTARLELANLHILRQDYEGAMHQYRTILVEDPFNTQAQEGIRELQNLPEFRMISMRKDIERDPRSIEARMRLTRFLYDQGRMDEARTEARAVLALDRRHEEARNIERNATIRADRERGERLSALRAELRQNPTDLNLHLELAQVLRDEGSYAEALRRYQLYLRANPFDMDIRREYAEILSWTEGNQQEAVYELRELLDFYPEDIDLRIQYARLLTFSREHWPEAEQELMELTLYDPTNLEIPLMLADLYRFQGRYNEARALYQEIIELSAVQWHEESRQASSRRYRSNRRNLWLEDSPYRETESSFVEARSTAATNQNPSMGRLGLGDSLYYESTHGTTRTSRPIYVSTRTNSYLSETESFYIRREVQEVLPTREMDRQVQINGAIARPLPGLEDHFRHAREGIIEMNKELRPQISGYIGSMVDNEDYSEFLIGARYFHFLSSGTRLHVGVDFGRHREKGFNPSMINSMSLALGIRGRITPRVTGLAEIGLTRYTRGISKTTVSGTLSGTYDLTPTYDLTLSYEKFDAIKEVKTISSLAAGVDVDRIALSLTSDPAYLVEGRPFHQRIFFDGRVSFANLSDNNNQTAFVLRPYYRMRDDPTVDLSLGWRGLSYSRQSPLYWSPSNYNGPFLQARIAGNGPWQGATYDVRAEFLITNESGSASRSLSAYLQHAFSESFFAGLSLTLSESPRDNDTYRYGALLLDALWRF